MRLFFAIPLPASPFLPWQNQIRLLSPSASFTSLLSAHITLAFLGETEESRLPLLGDILSGLSSPRLSLRFSRFGHFGDTWFAECERQEALMDLQARLASRLIDEALLSERRAFRPHLTLARKARVDSSALRARRTAVEADRLCLFHSLSEGGHVVHRPLMTLSFAPSPLL